MNICCIATCFRQFVKNAKNAFPQNNFIVIPCLLLNIFIRKYLLLWLDCIWLWISQNTWKCRHVSAILQSISLHDAEHFECGKSNLYQSNNQLIDRFYTK